MKSIKFKVGDKDKEGRKVIQISKEGWYKTEDGSLRDPNGFEWFAHTEDSSLPETKIDRDDIAGDKILVRDFKIVVQAYSFLEPQKFFEHHRKMIEATMVETGFDYDDSDKNNPPVSFGEQDDGFVHIYVRMKKHVWKNRDNIYSGAKQGQRGNYSSQALIKAGALDTHIHGAIETERVAADILANRKI